MLKLVFYYDTQMINLSRHNLEFQHKIISLCIRFNRLGLEGSRGCVFDHISAFEGVSTNRSQEIARYCGNQTERAPPAMKSHGNVMTVQFKTDGSIAHGG